MKTLEQLTKKQLIELIVKIRPKSDAYDRVCEELGIENNVIREIKKMKTISYCGTETIGAWCIGCSDKRICKLYGIRVT